jgi:hypothetical protein
MWFNLQKVRAYLVKGTPFLEDMTSRFPNKRLRVELSQEMTMEAIYPIFRKYGKIVEIDMESGKNAIVQFAKIRASTSARCCLHEAEINGTKFIVNYERSIKGNVIFAWLNEHAVVVAPAVLLLVGGFTFLIVDPIREFWMYAKITQIFDPDEYRILRWLKRETIGRLRLNHEKSKISGWSQKEDGEEKLRYYLAVPPRNLFSFFCFFLFFRLI